MKKTLKHLLLCATLLLLTAVPAASMNITNYAANPDSFFEPLLDMFATGANSGLGASTTTGKLLTFGVQANMTINPNEDILAQAENKENYTLPLLFANIKLGRLTVFARGLFIKQDNIDFKYYGGGLAFTLIKGAKFFPAIRLLGAYHRCEAEGAFFELQSITAAAIADYKLPLPILNLSVFAVAGYERNMLKTTWDEGVVLSPNKDLGMDRPRVSLGARLGLLKLLSISYEFTYLPNMNHNLSVSVHL